IAKSSSEVNRTAMIFVAIRIFVSFFEELHSRLYHSSTDLPNNLEELHAIIDIKILLWNSE
ncbi:MAG: hypothetical protein OES90_06120, partial [Xanthomonadales bacterium]|nr:hypothetical protein [Xanthomonadales bacterium]